MYGMPLHVMCFSPKTCALTSQVQSIIADMDGEFNVIKSERDATNKVLEEIYHKLNVAREELENLEKQHKILVSMAADGICMAKARVFVLDSRGQWGFVRSCLLCYHTDWCNVLLRRFPCTNWPPK